MNYTITNSSSETLEVKTDEFRFTFVHQIKGNPLNGKKIIILDRHEAIRSHDILGQWITWGELK